MIHCMYYQEKYIQLCRVPFFLFIVITTLLSIPLVTPAFAQSWYIKPSAEIPVRRGQGTDYKILVVLSHGTEVTIVDEQPPWVRIRTQTGKEGWMLKRYLTQDAPLNMVVEELRLQNEELTKRDSALNEELSFTKTQVKQISSERNSCTTELKKVKSDYQFLESATADVMGIRNNLIEKENEVAALTSQLSEVTEENKHLKRSRQTRWYLAGAGTLILGWLAGLMSSRSKKRRSSLY